MKNKKGVFGTTVALEEMPGYKARFNSLPTTGAEINLQLEKTPVYAADAEKDLRAKFGTGTDPRSLPSIILRRNGKRV